MTHKLSILQNATKKHVQINPFPHVYLPSCLPAEIYRELDEAYPSDDAICALDQWRRPTPGENERVDISALSALQNRVDLPQIWVDFIQYHTSPDFFSEVVSLFGDSIRRFYPTLESRIGNLDLLETGIRFCEQTDCKPLSLDCQVGINTPGQTTSSVIGPHCDSPVELYAGLLYFKRPEDDAEGGNLDLYSWKSQRQKLFRDEYKIADDCLIKKQMTIPAAANTLVMFINTIDSVHGVTPRSPSIVSRRLVNIIGEVYNPIPEGLYDRPQVAPGMAATSASLPLQLLHKVKSKLKLKAWKQGH